MPFVDAHQPGMFCWVELATLDPAAAKRFYQDLFGWSFSDFPMGEGEPYTIFRHHNRDAAAGYAMMPEQRAQGVPPNWLLYVTVASVDDTVRQVPTLGGTVMAGPMDVFDMGRMAVLQDPTGAVFALWQPKEHHGVTIENEPGALCWSELMTTDTAKAKAFYTALFGWKTTPMPMPDVEYTVFNVGEAPAGGMLPMPPGHDESIPPHWLPYFGVEDCDATVEKAKAAGSKVFLPPQDVPNVGRFAILSDPQGAAFAVIKPVPATA